MEDFNKSLQDNIQEIKGKSNNIEKGIYKDTPENRKKGRVGQQYGGTKKTEEGSGDNSKKFTALLNTDDDDKQIKFFEAVEKYAPSSDDGESESALVKRLSKLPQEKQQKILSTVGGNVKKGLDQDIIKSLDA